ncbi:cell envelope biogenesis protein OmpA [Serratia marcescens]|uniref:cell envelope biogenesis protein OmpA n=1 Tax=Serratia marcescens TaxID=615 RepID=UPI0011C4A61A|nr:cell envelope biogenesis protein OmpA [Serratia marcescens]EIM8479546.1 cell envelope biogenesis protein OmpA [Serratia marcescens]EIU9508443.1 cell envelope biogenesis protein OmpA [Serratia marcescens]MBH2619408.1 cell envelope biogenesis protein OmpA [Serratia marcescens]MBI6196239.1 cell envelope biogenesis protein OmpA [Serratia marcescens]MBN5270763.1 cell envelope biogenesis protein OmpA [Serratia marcescens]
MAVFTKEQVEAQIRDQLVRDGFADDVARSTSMRGADHYSSRPNATIASSLAIAKTYAKPLKRVKGKPNCNAHSRKK